MTTNIKPYTATQAYIDLIASGDGDFDGYCHFFFEHIENRGIGDAACAIKILEHTVCAYESYLENTFFGIIQSIFQAVFGKNSNHERAKEILPTLQLEITKFQTLDYKDKFDSQVEMILADFISRRFDEVRLFPQGSTPLNSFNENSEILIATPYGYKYMLPQISQSGNQDSGATRNFYPGTEHYHPSQLKEIPKHVGILTNMPKKALEPEIDLDPLIEKHSETTTDMQNEFTLLRALRDISGIIRVDDNFSTSIADLDVGFTIMQPHLRGDLFKFIGNEDYKKLNFPQKLAFLHSLATAFQGLHGKGYTHRDVKHKNILIDDNGLPVVIDFEMCVHQTDEKRKQTPLGTPGYLSPEYVRAVLFNRSKMNSVTTERIDDWALGLVFFHFMFGRDLIYDILGFKFIKDADLLMLPQFHSPWLTNFINAMNDPDTPDQNDWKEIHEIIRQQGNLELWEKVIVPLLALDPKNRATAADTVQALSSMISKIAT